MKLLKTPADAKERRNVIRELRRAMSIKARLYKLEADAIAAGFTLPFCNGETKSRTKINRQKEES
jgi:hypothetical protein